MLEPKVTGQKGQGCTLVWSVLLGINPAFGTPPIPLAAVPGRLVLLAEFGLRCRVVEVEEETGLDVELFAGCDRMSLLMLRASLWGEFARNWESEGTLMDPGSTFISEKTIAQLKFAVFFQKLV